MDDPLITNNFIKKVINFRKKSIIGIAKAKGDRTKTFNKSKIEYLFCLFWILGPTVFFRNVIYSIIFNLDNLIANLFRGYSRDSIMHFSLENNIPAYEVEDVNSQDFIRILEGLSPDIIINQSQQILKKELIRIPKIGVLNRHNSLLPRHRGRITPFWVLLNRDYKTGVSIHFVGEEIDEGPVVFQFSYPVNKRNFNELVKTNYQIAPLAMVRALEIIEKGEEYTIPITSESNYNSTPVFNDLVKFLKIRYGKRFYT